MKTVLVVDDEALIALALEAVLEDNGYQVLTASNGKKALELLAEELPDLVLLDMMMPVMNGPATVEAISADHRLRNLPVIIHSSLSEEAVRSRVANAAAILRKPASAEAVLETVARVLNGHAAPPGEQSEL